MSGRIFVDPESEREPTLAVVGLPDYDETYDLFHQLRREHQRVARAAWIGLLVTHCTNDQIRYLSTILSWADADDLRRMGLLAGGEGFDGSKASRTWCDERQAEWREAAELQRAAKARRATKGALS